MKIETEGNKALIIVDEQVDFVTGSLGSKYAEKEVVPNTVKLIQQFPKTDVYATQDTHYQEYWTSLEGKKLPVQHCMAGTEGHNLVPELRDLVLDDPLHRIKKVTFGANMDILLSIFMNYDEIHICGLCTDICVVSNALILRALFPNKVIVLHESCCGGTTKEAHDAAVTVMRSCQIDISET